MFNRELYQNCTGVVRTGSAMVKTQQSVFDTITEMLGFVKLAQMADYFVFLYKISQILLITLGTNKSLINRSSLYITQPLEICSFRILYCCRLFQKNIFLLVVRAAQLYFPPVLLIICLSCIFKVNNKPKYSASLRTDN